MSYAGSKELPQEKILWEGPSVPSADQQGDRPDLDRHAGKTQAQAQQEAHGGWGKDGEFAISRKFS